MPALDALAEEEGLALALELAAVEVEAVELVEMHGAAEDSAEASGCKYLSRATDLQAVRMSKTRTLPSRDPDANTLPAPLPSRCMPAHSHTRYNYRTRLSRVGAIPEQIIDIH